jgi:hypothetical protein
VSVTLLKKRESKRASKSYLSLFFIPFNKAFFFFIHTTIFIFFVESWDFFVVFFSSSSSAIYTAKVIGPVWLLNFFFFIFIFFQLWTHSALFSIVKRPFGIASVSWLPKGWKASWRKKKKEEKKKERKRLSWNEEEKGIERNNSILFVAASLVLAFPQTFAATKIYKKFVCLPPTHETSLPIFKLLIF